MEINQKTFTASDFTQTELNLIDTLIRQIDWAGDQPRDYPHPLHSSVRPIALALGVPDLGHIDPLFDPEWESALAESGHTLTDLEYYLAVLDFVCQRNLWITDQIQQLIEQRNQSAEIIPFPATDTVQ